MQKQFGDLTIEVFEQAEVMPLYKDAFGVYAGGIFLKESHIQRKDKPSQKIPEYRTCSAEMLGTAIYGGRLINHFGHFLLESLPRLWYTSTDPVSPIIFFMVGMELNSFQKAIMETLNIKNPIIILKEPTVVSKLIIPSIGYRIQDYFSDYHADFLARHPYQREKATRKIWLSRSQLVHCIHRVENEANLECALALQGWEIIHPQNHSISEQLDTLATAKIVAGFVGSAFHMLLLIRDFQGKVILLNRTSGGVNRNYLTIAEVKKINQIIVHPQMVELLSDKRRCDLLIDYSTIFRALEIPVPDTVTELSESLKSKRINRLLVHTNAVTYLQFGCDRDHFFNHIQIESKYIVAPAFGFPFESTKSTHFFELSTEDFMLRSIGRKQSFDIIVIANAMSFEQVYRIFCLTLIGALDKTVWVVDNIMPAGIKVSHSDGVIYRKPQKRQKGEKLKQSDIYKFIYILHYYFPNYSYAVTAGAKPQLYVWKATRAISPSLPHSYKRVSELDYSDLQEDFAKLNIKPFNAILSEVNRALSKSERAQKPIATPDRVECCDGKTLRTIET